MRCETDIDIGINNLTHAGTGKTVMTTFDNRQLLKGTILGNSASDFRYFYYTLHRHKPRREQEDIPGPFDRTMFGAYVLFPYADEEKYKEHDSYKNIGTVNIGGLPFMPSTTTMVGEFLEELILNLSESAFERATLPRGIEEKLARMDWAKRDVLIVNVPDEGRRDIGGTFAHSPCCALSTGGRDRAVRNGPVHADG